MWVERGGRVLAHVFDKADADEIVAALAAQSVLDPEKVAEVIDRCGKWTEIEQLQITNYPNGYTTTPCAQYIASALCEAHENGELA